MRHSFIFFVTFLLTSLSYDDNSDIVQIEKSEQDIIEMAKRPLVLQKPHFFCAIIEVMPLFSLLSSVA